MKVFTKRAELSAALAATPGVCGFVPTMGALHKGHLSLAEECSSACDTVVVSIFVNPTQFNDPNDLKKYPRTLESDLNLLEEVGVDFVFAPSTDEVYPEQDTRRFDFGPLDQVMEGARRPGHFNGVAQVVSRLFDLVRCDKAYFGEKDFQQVAVIRALVRQLNMPVEIVACPIIRDVDGLALSSRNALLTPLHRKAAPAIYEALQMGVALAGNVSVAQMKQQVVDQIHANALLQVEYFEVVDADTLQPVVRWEDAPVLRGCIAVQAGTVRLIDNVAIR